MYMWVMCLIDSDTVPTGILGIYYGKWCHFVSCTVSWCSLDSVHQRCTYGSCVSLILILFLQEYLEFIMVSGVILSAV